MVLMINLFYFLLDCGVQSTPLISIENICYFSVRTRDTYETCENFKLNLPFFIYPIHMLNT
jgi:hypothetical protein